MQSRHHIHSDPYQQSAVDTTTSCNNGSRSTFCPEVPSTSKSSAAASTSFVGGCRCSRHDDCNDSDDGQPRPLMVADDAECLLVLPVSGSKPTASLPVDCCGFSRCVNCSLSSLSCDCQTRLHMRKCPSSSSLSGEVRPSRWNNARGRCSGSCDRQAVTAAHCCRKLPSSSTMSVLMFVAAVLCARFAGSWAATTPVFTSKFDLLSCSVLFRLVWHKVY